MPWDAEGKALSDIAINNAYYYTSQLVANYGAAPTLLMIGIFLVTATLLKTSCYFASVATMVPVRTGIVRDIRNTLYNKITSLPLSFFSDERKGDIIARMSGDVGEVENSIMGSLEMLVKNPILIAVYFGSLLYISWELTLFTLVILPTLGWAMGRIGRRLKQSSLEAQEKWSETMSQLEETLGGMRIIKAFGAEEKMQRRFNTTTNDFRDIYMRVAIRQGSAHPVSEFLGTCLIVLVLWYGGTLIFSDNSPIDAPTFIFYMVILYSVIQPLKDLTKATYAIPKGMASMERINKILLAENPIREPEHPTHIEALREHITFKDVRFAYKNANSESENTEVIRGVSFTGAPRTDDCPRGTERKRQEYAGRPRAALPRRDRRQHFYRRTRRAHTPSFGTPRTDRQCQPRSNPFQRHFLQQHQLRRRKCNPRTSAGGRQSGECPRLHHGNGGRLRHFCGRSRLSPLRRTKTTHIYRKSHLEKSRYPHSRRSHFGTRHRK